jgi:hypothetical protein
MVGDLEAALLELGEEDDVVRQAKAGQPWPPAGAWRGSYARTWERAR